MEKNATSISHKENRQETKEDEMQRPKHRRANDDETGTTLVQMRLEVPPPFPEDLVLASWHSGRLAADCAREPTWKDVPSGNS
jgi:hypothetical protein